jgi:hypothetical protein
VLREIAKVLEERKSPTIRLQLGQVFFVFRFVGSHAKRLHMVLVKMVDEGAARRKKIHEQAIQFDLLIFA